MTNPELQFRAHHHKKVPYGIGLIQWIGRDRTQA